jgi:hypothetical protein
MTDQRHDLEPRRASRAHHSRRSRAQTPIPRSRENNRTSKASSSCLPCWPAGFLARLIAGVTNTRRLSKRAAAACSHSAPAALTWPSARGRPAPHRMPAGPPSVWRRRSGPCPFEGGVGWRPRTSRRRRPTGWLGGGHSGSEAYVGAGARGGLHPLTPMSRVPSLDLWPGPGRGVTVARVRGLRHAGQVTAGSMTLPQAWRKRMGGPACGPTQRSPQAVSAMRMGTSSRPDSVSR